MAREDDLCEKCQGELAEGHSSSSTSHWMDKVIAALELVLLQRPAPQRPHKAVLWDVFDLDPYNGGCKKYSDRGAFLGRLDAKTLYKLRDWLADHEEEAIKRYGRTKYVGLYRAVSLIAALKTLPDKPLLPKKRRTDLPFEAAAYYTRRGSSRDLTLPILAARRAEELRQQRRHVTKREIERTIEDECSIPRTTQKRWSNRMKKVGMTWYRFTTDQLTYVVLGETRGRRKSKSEEDSEA